MLRTQKEKMEALLAGKKIRAFGWGKNSYVFLGPNGSILNHYNSTDYVPDDHCEEYTLPEQEPIVKTLYRKAWVRSTMNGKAVYMPGLWFESKEDALAAFSSAEQTYGDWETMELPLA